MFSVIITIRLLLRYNCSNSVKYSIPLWTKAVNFAGSLYLRNIGDLVETEVQFDERGQLRDALDVADHVVGGHDALDVGQIV